jgi:hypothetical protein
MASDSPGKGGTVMATVETASASAAQNWNTASPEWGAQT